MSGPSRVTGARRGNPRCRTNWAVDGSEERHEINPSVGHTTTKCPAAPVTITDHRCEGQAAHAKQARTHLLSEWWTNPLFWTGRRSCRACSRASRTKSVLAERDTRHPTMRSANVSMSETLFAIGSRTMVERPHRVRHEAAIGPRTMPDALPC